MQHSKNAKLYPYTMATFTYKYTILYATDVEKKIMKKKENLSSDYLQHDLETHNPIHKDRLGKNITDEKKILKEKVAALAEKFGYDSLDALAETLRGNLFKKETPKKSNDYADDGSESDSKHL